MKWKTTLVLLLLAVGVGAYVSLYELKQPLPEQRQELAKRILHLSPEEITSFSINLPGTKVTLKKEGDAWRLTTPLSARADQSLMQRILSQLEWLEAERVLAGTKEKPLDRAPYGLAPPPVAAPEGGAGQRPGPSGPATGGGVAPAHGSLTISTKDAPITLLFGEKTAVGNNGYLARADWPQVFVVSSSLLETLDQPLESYRSHALVDVNTAALTSLTVSSPTSAYALAKAHGQWRLTEPLQDAANPTEVGTLLNHLNGLRIERFMDEHAEMSAHPEWGFQTPSAKLTVTLEGGAPLEILFGSGTNDNAQQRYAKRSDEPTLYAVDATGVEALLKDPQTLRVKPPPEVTGAGGSPGAPEPPAATRSGE